MSHYGDKLSDDLSCPPHLIHRLTADHARHPPDLAISLWVLAIAFLLTIVGILTPVTGALLHKISATPVIANSAR